MAWILKYDKYILWYEYSVVQWLIRENGELIDGVLLQVYGRKWWNRVVIPQVNELQNSANQILIR